MVRKNDLKENLNIMARHEILDEDVPKIDVKPLAPRKYPTIENQVATFVKKNANKVAYWILNVIPQIVRKVLPEKIVKLIELSKSVTYKSVPHDEFWKLNIPYSDNDLIAHKIQEARLKYGDKNNSKQLKMYFYNNIRSLDDIKQGLIETYEKENNAFKVMLSFGYVTEKQNLDSGIWESQLFYPSQNYYHDKPTPIKNRKDINVLLSEINRETIIHKLAQQFPDTKTRLVGVFSMGVKVTRLDFPIGSNINLPDYIQKSRYVVGLEDVKNNLCFWACIALATGARRDRYLKRAKELFVNFYQKAPTDDYKGFDYVNELDKYEQLNSKFAVNIITYLEDESIEYVKKSIYNAGRQPIYLNLYLNHFSYITNLEKLAKMYICNRCSGKFQTNFHLQRHIDTCQLEQEDTFVKYPEIYEKKRNDIVELCEWFNIDCDYKHDYLVTFDFESLQQYIEKLNADKLKFISEHIPVSVSIATNVPGFEVEHFILSRNPNTICIEMFEYFDAVANKSKSLMMEKMDVLIQQVKMHYNENEKEKFLNIINNYCSNIPVVGFNSSFYDLNLISKYGFMKEIFDRDRSPFVIKSGTRYKVIKTLQFTFLDQMNYCAAGTSLAKFIKAYDIEESKGLFPYEWFDSYEKLDYLVKDLKKENFNSSLKNTEMDQDTFDKLMKTLESLNIIYVKDLLKWYNNLDVGPMLKACLKQKEFYYTFKLDMYKDGFSLPGLSENILFQFSQVGFAEYMKEEPDVNTGQYFSPKNVDKKIEQYKEQDRIAKRSLENFITKEEVTDLFKKQKYVCHYCWAIGTVYNWSLDRINCSKGHILGNCVIACIKCNVQRKDMIMQKFLRKKALLRFAKTHPMIHLIDEKNKTVFYKLKNNIVGGPSIVYHRYHEKGITKINRVHYNHERREWYFGENGKKCQSVVGFDANALYLYCLGQDMLCGKLEWIPTEEEYKIESEKSIILQKELQKTMENKSWLQFLESFFGALEVDIEIPEDKYNVFGEMPPLFKNIELCEEEGGDYMKKLILGINGKFSKSRKLISSLKAVRILIKSTYLEWLVKKGAVITKIYGVIPAQKGKPFKDFAEWVSSERRKGDRDAQNSIIAEAAKTVGNAAYGRTGMNKNKFHNVRFCDEKQFNRAKNNYFYYDAEEYDGIYEVSMNPKHVKQNIPIQVAYTVLNDAKLRMSQFYYDCIDKYLDRKDYQYMYMDTDSAYMALSDKFENLIQPELRDEYELEKNNWFPREDTTVNKNYDKRTPGLFKIEYEGDGMIALCSKTYYTWGNQDKFSSKGIQKSANEKALCKEAYKRCLIEEETISFQNRGFRYIDGAMKTYEQEKIGLTPIYVKGIVMNDGIHIHPLNI